MKKQFLTFLVLVTLSSSLALGAGGISGGGGGPLGTKPKELEVALRYYALLKGIKPFNEVKNRIANKTLLTIEDNKIRKIYTDIINLSELQPPKEEKTYKDIGEALDALIGKKSKVIKVEPTNGNCYDPEGNPTASHYVKGSRNPIRICVSIPLLKILSLETLSEEIPNLLVHELAHAAGYGEKDARLAQAYFYTLITKDCNFTAYSLDGELRFSYGEGNSDSFSAYKLKVSVRGTQTDFAFKGYPRTEHVISLVNDYEDVISNISWSGESGFSFRYPDTNGNTRAGFIKFKLDKVDIGGRSEYLVTDSYVIVGGKKLEFSKLTIDSGCIAKKQEF